MEGASQAASLSFSVWVPGEAVVVGFQRAWSVARVPCHW